MLLSQPPAPSASRRAAHAAPRRGMALGVQRGA